MHISALFVLSVFGISLCAAQDPNTTASEDLKKKFEAEEAAKLKAQQQEAMKLEFLKNQQIQRENEMPVAIPTGQAVVNTVPVVPTVQFSTPTGTKAAVVGPAQPAILTNSQPTLMARSDETSAILKGFTDLLRPRFMVPDQSGQLRPLEAQQQPTASNIHAALQQPQPPVSVAQPIASAAPIQESVVQPQTNMFPVQTAPNQPMMDPRMMDPRMMGYGQGFLPQVAMMPIPLGRADQQGQMGLQGQYGPEQMMMMGRDVNGFPLNMNQQYGGRV